jgi:hypothetical protein
MKGIEIKGIAVVAGLLLLVAGATTHAAERGGTYVQGAFADWDGFDDGFNIAGSFQVAPNVRLFGEYTNTDLEHWRLGAGYLVPMQGFELELGGTWQRFEVGNFDDDGIGVHGIARVGLTDQFWLSGRAEYVFLDDLDNETIFGADLEFRVTPEFGVFIGYDFFDNADNLLRLGARLHF